MNPTALCALLEEYQMDIPMHKITARLIEHHSVLIVDPQSAQVVFEGSIPRIVVRMLGVFVAVTVLSFPPVRSSLVS